jgi:hypothetical protein
MVGTIITLIILLSSPLSAFFYSSRCSPDLGLGIKQARRLAKLVWLLIAIISFVSPPTRCLPCAAAPRSVLWIGWTPLWTADSGQEAEIQREICLRGGQLWHTSAPADGADHVGWRGVVMEMVGHRLLTSQCSISCRPWSARLAGEEKNVLSAYPVKTA